jgi:uncharacterized membrane protein YkvA (DUF1232 family)
MKWAESSCLIFESASHRRTEVLS